MSEPKTPTTRPGLLDVPVKRKTRKSAFLRKLERNQADNRLVAEARQQRIQEAAERALKPRRALPSNVTRLKP